VPKSAVVLLHGYGSDGLDLIALGQAFAPQFPHTLFVAPNGPQRCDINPGGYQWFPLDFENPMRRLADAYRAGPVVVQFLEDLWAQTGLTAAQTVLCGFSQGAMMALHVGLSLPDKLAGIVAFSGALIPPERPPSPGAPILLIHGEFDEVVPAAESVRAEAELRRLGHTVTHRVSPGIGHSISTEGLGEAVSFLKEVLPG
jgi:phospholipase/carboxylesterase